MLSYLLSFVGGASAGLLVNVLSDILPQYRAKYDDEEETLSEEAEVSAPVSWRQRLTSFRYIAVMLILALLTVVIWHQPVSLTMKIVHTYYITLFTLIAVIDIEHRLILNVVMLPAFAIAFIELFITRRLNAQDALVGYAVGQLTVMVFYLLGALYLWIVNANSSEPVREVAFGFGDVTLATFCGLVLGYPLIAYMVVLMILVGGLLAFIYLTVRFVISRRYERHQAIPYGPAIVIAAGLMMLFPGEIIPRLFGWK